MDGMNGTQMQAPAPVPIEIVDPVIEPVGERWVDVAASTSTSPADGVDEWIRSLLDAAAAARRHVDPMVERGAAAKRRAQAVGWTVRSWSLQLRTDGNPRRGSAVRQHVFAPFATVAGRLPEESDPIRVRRGVTLALTSGFAPLPGGGRRADATLALRGSWPRLPVDVRVEPWWREQSIVTVELRNRRRIRYPRRYFRAAHDAARAFGATIAR